MISSDIIKTVLVKTMAAVVNSIHMRRIGDPEEVADIVTFLIRDQTNHTSRQFVNITSGW